MKEETIQTSGAFIESWRTTAGEGDKVVKEVNGDSPHGRPTSPEQSGSLKT
jgi:hypothetical protein